MCVCWQNPKFPEFHIINQPYMDKAQIWNLGYWDSYNPFFILPCPLRGPLPLCVCPPHFAISDDQSRILLM